MVILNINEKRVCEMVETSMAKKDNYFGVSIEMAQWIPYTKTNWDSSSKFPLDDWSFSTFGHFDRMKMEVIEENEIEKFYPSTHKKKVRQLELDKRINRYTETQKIFLYTSENVTNLEDDSNAKLIDKNTINKWSKSNENTPYHNFIALVAIKYRQEFYRSPFYDKCNCIAKSISNFSMSNIDEKTKSCWHVHYRIFHTLGLDDRYLMLSADDPSLLIKCIYELHEMECNCLEESGEKDKNNYSKEIKEAFGRAWKKAEYHIKQKKNCDVMVNQIRLLVEECKELFENPNGVDFCCIIKKFGEEINKICGVKKYSTELSEYEMCLHRKVQRWVFECYRILLLLQKFPPILMTHTMFGIKDWKNKSYHPFSEIDFQFVGQSKPGIARKVPEYHMNLKEILEGDIPKGQAYATLGRYEYQWVGKMNDTILGDNRLVDKFYEQDTVRHISGNFAAMFDETASPHLNNLKKRLIKMNEHYNKSIVFAQHKDAKRRFDGDGSSKGIYEIIDCEQYPILAELLDTLNELHIQGCQRMYYLSTWHEAWGIEAFFDTFYGKLKRTASLLEKDDNDKSHNQGEFYKIVQKNILTELYHNLEVGIKSLSSLFNDRMISEMAMHENTYPSLYASGAFEDLFRRYTEWINSVRSVMCALSFESLNREGLVSADSMDDAKFMLFPTEWDNIHTFSLFPISTYNDSLVFFEMSIKKMLDIRHAMRILVHECGYFVGIIERAKRAETYIRMCANYYAEVLTADLCNRKEGTEIPIDIVRNYTETLAKELGDYLLNERNKMAEDSSDGGKNMSITKKAAFYAAPLELFLSNEIQKIPKEIDKDIAVGHNEKDTLMSAFENLFYVTGAGDVFSTEGVIYGVHRSDDALVRMMSVCREVLKECHADLLMISLLKMTTENYVVTLLKALKDTIDLNPVLKSDVSNKKVRDAHGSDFDSVYAIFALRAITALVSTFNSDGSMSETGDTVADEIRLLRDKIKNTINEIDIIFKDQEEIIQMWELLKEYMKIIIEESYEKSYKTYAYHIVHVWRIALPYILLCRDEINKEIDRLKEVDLKKYENNEELSFEDRIRVAGKEHYDKINELCEKMGMNKYDMNKEDGFWEKIGKLWRKTSKSKKVENISEFYLLAKFLERNSANE